MSKSKKEHSRALRDYGLIEEYYNLNCSPKTIARLTGLTVERTEKIIMEIEKKKEILKGGK